MNRSRLSLTLGMAAAACSALACETVPTDPDAVFSLEAAPLPFPSVVAGDSLRNEGGAAVRVQATAYNGRGDPVPGAAVAYFSNDPDVTIEDGFVVAGSTGESGRPVRIFASAGRMTLELSSQSPLRVIPEPALLEIVGEPPDSVSWGAPSVRSEPIEAALSSAPVGEATAGEPAVGWLVRYTLSFRGVELPPEDPRFRVVAPGGTGEVVSPVDTTGSDGRTSREVVVLDPSAAEPGETLTVMITARVRGADLAGSPAELSLRLTGSVPAPPE